MREQKTLPPALLRVLSHAGGKKHPTEALHLR